MRYFVTVDGREFAIDVDGDRVSVGGREHRAHLSPVPGTPLRHLLLGPDSVTLVMEPGAPGRWQIQRRGTRRELLVEDERTRHIRRLTGAGTGATGPAQLKAPMPGLVVRVLVTPGQVVAPGQGLVVLEAMKMENELRATVAGTVAAVGVVPGAAVEKGQVLLEFA
ncbi:MAG TPA: biotin/lipoyl-containing protein [Gemmatimonadales bacterium]|nr:biotin/lipoyl-containing protein [Gemmatimonadales bacterium]